MLHTEETQDSHGISNLISDGEQDIKLEASITKEVLVI